MKKLLLCSAAALGVALSAAPAAAQIDVTVGGHSKNYIGWLDQDEAAGAEARSFDMLRESELHVNAEGTADNGLIYGFHVEMEVDAEDGGDGDIEESYVYLSTNMGRVNLGSEDGANYLLQVAAPSADSNVDGIRQYVQPVNYTVAGAPAGLTALVAADGIDYDNDSTGTSQKITYLSPVFSGFQFGASYTPDVEDTEVTGLTGFNADDVADDYGSAYEAAARYEGVFNNVGFAVGAGYTHVDLEEDGALEDDINEWNVGADLDIGAFGIGAVYTETNDGLSALAGSDDETETWVLGADYTTGPFQFGASYLNADHEGIDVETDRYTGGVIYTAAPGLTFRGSVSHIEHDVAGGDDIDATSVLGGVQFNF